MELPKALDTHWVFLVDMGKDALEGENRKPVAQRHQMVGDSLALLLFIGLDLTLESRAAALIEGKVL